MEASFLFGEGGGREHGRGIILTFQAEDSHDNHTCYYWYMVQKGRGVIMMQSLEKNIHWRGVSGPY